MHPSHPSPRHGGGAEKAQNFLVRRSTIRAIVALATRDLSLPLVEFGPGKGALTGPLLAAGADLTVVEIDPLLAARLRRLHGPALTVVEGDMLAYRLRRPCRVVSNVPFHLTTPLLRRLLADDHWRSAVLLLQWEVARRRAAVGGTTLMTASWWPWYDFQLEGRVPAQAFRPVPSVDGGILRIERRGPPMLPQTERAAYQALVAAVFAGRGRDLRDVVGRVVGRRLAGAWMRANRLSPKALPRALTATQWVDLHRRASGR